MSPRYFCVLLLLVLSACRSGERGAELPPDTIRSTRTTTQTDSTSRDTTIVRKDTATSNLPPMAKAVEPEKLIPFLPKMPGYSQGELQKEIKVRTNFNSTKVDQTYTMDNKKVYVELNDYAYIPYLYTPFDEFKGNYLQDDNEERTETTVIMGARAVQTWEKRNARGTIFLFPGTRYVVKIVMDDAADINQVRAIASSMDLKGLEALQ